ncbi:MAG: hypothetical protein KC421_04930, partial [Anaerolineales bacterium]|nr:hypothetical protein [Anaerolineales bacterium]
FALFSHLPISIAPSRNEGHTAREKQPHCHAYLLRCRQEQDAHNDISTWRFSLEGVQDSKRHGFADLHALLAFFTADNSIRKRWK